MSDGEGRTIVIFPRGQRLPFGRIPVWTVLVVVLLLWLGSGIYQVEPGEVGVIRQFGRYARTSTPGLHWRVPYPVEQVNIVQMESTRQIEVGYRTVRQGEFREVKEESLMLTADENIVDLEFTVQYRVKDPVQFLFNVRNPEEAVRVAAESAIRATVGSRMVDHVLTTGRAEVQQETHRLLQELMDKYESGVLILSIQLQDVNPPEQVIDAFKDVASAREEKQRLINDAQSYQNDVIPKARGEAEKQLREAEAFAAERVARADGDAKRFLAILEEYEKGREVNRTRMYLEAMEQLLQGMEVYVVDEQAGRGIVPYLPLGPGGVSR